jgi:hypothetical protein
MAITVGQRAAPNAGLYTETGVTSTTVVTPGTTIAAGSLAIIFASSNANKTFSSVADSTGANTWAVNHTVSDGTRALSFASAQVATQIPSSTGSVTITWSAATSSTVLVWIAQADGMATSNAADKNASGTGSGTSFLTSSTGTLSQADELVIAIARTTGSGQGWTKGASYTNFATPQSLTNPGTGVEYKIVSATDAVTADGSWSASGTWIIACQTYKGAAAAPPSGLYQPGIRFAFT